MKLKVKGTWGYLGLPVHVSHSKTKAFEYIKDKIQARIQGWKEKLPYMEGKEILINAISQAIPTCDVIL